jgi:hypothetical protein
MRGKGRRREIDNKGVEEGTEEIEEMKTMNDEI